jgi:diguanylate cyclase (GGDEF)-like protein
VLSEPELEIRDALKRLRAEGVERLGERVVELVAGWATLSAKPVWDADTRAAARVLAASAHRLAGAGGTFGFPGISAAAAPLEVMLLGLCDRSTDAGGRMVQTTRFVEAVHTAWESGPILAAVPEAEAGTAAQSDGSEPIFLFAMPEEQAKLSAVITNLGYPVERGKDVSALAGYPTTRLAAAVVDDAVPGALEICESLSSRCPVILLAQEDGFEARLLAARAGVTAVVAKPLVVNELADWLDHFASRGNQPRYSILVVDDDALLAEAYALALRRAGMLVSMVSDPARASEALAAAHPDLILMDMQMPGVDGIELAKVIRQTRRHLSVPIVFLSAEQDSARQIQARRLGGDDFIAKPVDLDRLVTLIKLRAERARALRAVMESDSLTGLLNHARFKERLALEMERARREETPLSLVIIDLDHFKNVNDTHGHLVGDRVIRGLARSLQKHLRRTDVIGRYGGEEFAVLLLDTTPDAAAPKMDRIRERFGETPFDGAAGAFRVTFSAGIAGNGGTTQPEALISAADAALYVAKRAGRNRVVRDGEA